MGSRRKPLVGIIHSASSTATTTGDDLAVYLGVCLQLGGYADVRIVGFNGSKTSTSTSTSGNSKGASAAAATCAPPHGKFSVVPYGGSKPEHPNHAECCRDTWESLTKCDMVLVCVDPPDTPTCAKALSCVVEKDSDKAIIVFDLGVRNHAAAEEHLSNHGVVFLSGAAGISVARSPVNGQLQCLGAGSLVVERLTKKQSKQGVKFVDLLRSGGIPLRHCKNVTCYTHGVVVFNSVHTVAALAGVPLQDLVRDRHARLLWAAMIREGLQVLTRAAGHGDWRAANPCCSATLPQLELMLCLPSPLFVLVSRLILRFPPVLAPAMQTDLAAGRETNVAWTLEEIVRIADKHKVAAPVCSTMLSGVKHCVSRGDGVPSTPTKDLPLAKALRSGGSESTLAMQLKLTVWCSSMAAGGTALRYIGGPWLAAGGSMLVFLLAFIKYILVGDIVP